MTQTLRRELRKAFEAVLVRNHACDTGSQNYWEIVVNELADAALEVSAIAKRADLAKSGVDWAILGGQKVDEETQGATKAEHDAVNAFETAFGITRPWDWWNIKADWRDLREMVVKEFRADAEVFKRYVAWYADKGKFEGGMNATQIKRQPDLFFVAWDVFKKQDKGQTVGRTSLIRTLK